MRDDARLRFDAKSISDQKRLVRGEQLLYARGRLRVRDVVHYRKWRILVLAGGSPTGEVDAIRELMPSAHIVAVDRDSRCLEAAIDAGVDEVVQCDLTSYTREERGQGRKPILGPAAPLCEMQKFDVVSLDLCGGANWITREIVQVYRKLLAPRGVLIVTFSYGRDVTEAYRERLNNYVPKRLLESGASDLLCGRIAWLFPNGQIQGLRSIAVYKGAEMPMCSVLFHSVEYTDPVSFLQVEPGDFELAVVYPEAANLYDCPQERIETLRRKFAALKATFTRAQKAALSPLPFEKPKDES